MATQVADELQVGLVGVAGGHGDGPALAVESHIDDEVEPRQSRGGEHLIVDRVALEDPRPRRRGGQHVQAMIADDALVAGDGGQDRLAAAGEAGELMGLDLAEGDPQVGFGHAPVHQERRAARCAADRHEVGGAGVVVGDPQPASPFFAEQPPDLVGRGRAMGAYADDHLDAVARDAAARELRHDRTDERRAGRGPGRIRGDDHGRTPFAGELVQRRCAGGSGEGRPQRRLQVERRRVAGRELDHLVGAQQGRLGEPRAESIEVGQFIHRCHLSPICRHARVPPRRHAVTRHAAPRMAGRARSWILFRDLSMSRGRWRSNRRSVGAAKRFRGSRSCRELSVSRFAVASGPWRRFGSPAPGPRFGRAMSGR